MIKLLIAVKSCEFDRSRGAHNLVRDTWGKDVKDTDLKFFMGNGATTSEKDEMVIDAPDNYIGLPFKTREIVRYALADNYDYIFLCDTGSFLIPHHLVAYDFSAFDYMGYWGLKPNTFPFEAQDRNRGCRLVYIDECFPWASGGGYFLSKRAMGIIATNEPFVWAEDLWVGQELARKGILLEDRARDGYNGYIVRWIHNEDNSRPDSMTRRQRWMEKTYEECKERCRIEGCTWPSLDRNQPARVTPEPSEVDRIIEERREARRQGKQ